METSRLLQPVRLGSSSLSHRIGMAPLTRYRADDDHVPVPLMTEYYAQRASVPGGFILTEGTFISLEDGGYANVPGIYTEAQISGWKAITDAVHAKGGVIFCQLWAIGRAADKKVTDAEGTTIKGADVIPIDESSPVPVKLTVEEIKKRVQNYATAADNAIKAGFDGVEIHGANGYFVDQFLQDVSNQRNDEYGGSIENRSRFGLEVAQAVANAIGADKTGIRLSPFSSYGGMKMADPIPQFSHFISKLNDLDLAYLHLVESRVSGNADVEAVESIDFAYDVWQGTMLVAGGYKPDSARRKVDEERSNRNIIVIFGRLYIANPDLPYRIRHGIELNPYDRKTFYNAKSPVGYIDQPYSQEYIKATEQGVAKL